MKVLNTRPKIEKIAWVLLGTSLLSSQKSLQIAKQSNVFVGLKKVAKWRVFEEMDCFCSFYTSSVPNPNDVRTYGPMGYTTPSPHTKIPLL